MLGTQKAISEDLLTRPSCFSHCWTAERSLLPGSPPVALSPAVWASKVKGGDWAEQSPAPSYSDLSTMAASRVQQYFPKLHCEAESPGAIFKRFWLWYPGICCSQQLNQHWSPRVSGNSCCSVGQHGWSPFPQATSRPLPVSKVSRSNRSNIDPWSSNTFILKLFFLIPQCSTQKSQCFQGLPGKIHPLSTCHFFFF